MQTDAIPNFYCSVYEKDLDSSSVKGIVVSRHLDEVTRSLDSQTADELETINIAQNPNVAEETELGLDLNHFFYSLQKYYELSSMTRYMGSSFVEGYHSTIITKIRREQSGDTYYL